MITPKTNAQYVKEVSKFKDACVTANVKCTSRQASKFRNDKGIAWKVMTGRAESLIKGNPGYEEYNV